MQWVNVFGNDERKQYILLTDDDLESVLDSLDDPACIKDVFDIMEPSGYKLMTANCHTYDGARRWVATYYPEYQPVRYEIIPLSFHAACSYVNQQHRHHAAPQGYKFALGATDGISLVGVIIAGRPVSRYEDNGRTLEITRLCTRSGFKNLCSLLYARVLRIAKEMGYTSVITYTLEDEPGTSLKAAGFHFEGIVRGGSWNGARRRIDKHPVGPKKRWRVGFK